MTEFPAIHTEKEQLIQHLTDEPKRVMFLSKEKLADKDIARAVLYSSEAKRSDILSHFPDSIKDDIGLLASALPSIRSANETIRSNKTLMNDIINERPHEFGYSGKSLFSDHEYCRNAIDKLPSNVSRLPKDHPLLNDRGLALNVVSKDPNMLEHFKKFQDDAEVVHAGYKREEELIADQSQLYLVDDTILQYASDRIQKACETDDPHKVLNIMTLERKLQNSMAVKQSAPTRSIKI